MSKLEAKIQKYYDDFKRDFNKKNFPGVFQLIEEQNLKKNRKRHEHDLGSFAILYTPVRYRPKLMMIGNNPSWFDKDDGDRGYRIVKGLMQSPPKENSYVNHNHSYASKMRLIFNRIGRMDLLNDCVGMNRWWLQTGTENTHFNKPSRERSFDLNQSLYEYCETRTKEIISLIEPRVVLLVGKKAQKLMPEETINNTKIKHVDYPFGGGITLLQNELNEIIKLEID